MANNYTDAQLERAFIEVGGHLLELHARWKLFRKLYRGNEDSQPILKEVASEMFWLLGRLLHRGSLLLFRQLTDGPLTSGRRNASLEGMLKAVAGDSYLTTEPDLMKELDAARQNKAIRDHGNKYIAHLDLDLLAGVAAPPTSIEIEEFENALSHMRTFANGMASKFFGGLERDFAEEAELMTRQADILVGTLKNGLVKEH
ncbi:MAG: hypothetical protein WB973_04290 [Thermoanaerobaculia bacterium]